MNNNYTSPRTLPRFSDFLQKQKSSIDTVINNLQLVDVETDDNFEKTTKIIKENILVKTIEIGEPYLDRHEYQKSNPSFQQQLIGANPNHYYHYIHFPYTGNTEILNHQPDTFSFTSSDHGLIIPYYGSPIEVVVDLPELNAVNAIAQANRLLRMTFEFMATNNTTSNNWNKTAEHLIEQKLVQKREEIIKQYKG